MADHVSCDTCGKQYVFKPTLAGKRVKCKCGGRIAFPALVTPAAEEISEAADAEQDPLAALSGRRLINLDDIQSPGETITNVCRTCSTPLQLGAAICTMCGTNQRTGERMQTMVQKAPPPPPRPVKQASSHNYVAVGGGGWRIGLGLLMTVGGIVASIFSYNSAAPGQTYVVFTGLIAGGLGMMVRGMFSSGD